MKATDLDIVQLDYLEDQSIQKERVEELAEDHQEDQEIGEEQPDGNLPDDDGGDANDMGMGDTSEMVARLLLTIIDESRAAFLSNMVYKNIDQREKYLFYKDLDDHKEMVSATAVIVKKYSMLNTPEAIVLVGLAVSSWLLYQTAKSDKQQLELEQQEQAAKAAAQKQPTKVVQMDQKFSSL